ncbi:3'-5' exonuclease [Pectobacterium versatile]|uniref:3'-5' exonuclease n=1 Tax=Pectobacterium versatile TaxID=2488639 RepID=UPI001CCC88EB
MYLPAWLKCLNWIWTTSSNRRNPLHPLLLKGLEFDHVVIPNVPHFVNERQAQAKRFYVAISRATRSLTISSPDRFIQFPIPNV